MICRKMQFSSLPRIQWREFCETHPYNQMFQKENFPFSLYLWMEKKISLFKHQGRPSTSTRKTLSLQQQTQRKSVWWTFPKYFASNWFFFFPKSFSFVLSKEKLRVGIEENFLFGIENNNKKPKIARSPYALEYIIVCDEFIWQNKPDKQFFFFFFGKGLSYGFFCS